MISRLMAGIVSFSFCFISCRRLLSLLTGDDAGVAVTPSAAAKGFADTARRSSSAFLLASSSSKRWSKASTEL